MMLRIPQHDLILSKITVSPRYIKVIGQTRIFNLQTLFSCELYCFEINLASKAYYSKFRLDVENNIYRLCPGLFLLDLPKTKIIVGCF